MSPGLRRLGLGCGGLVGLAGTALAGVVGWSVLTWEDALDRSDTPLPALSASTDPALVERGRYLVHGPAHCSACHSATDRDHPEAVATEPLHGGLAFEMGPIGTLYARNLTPDPETGIGRRTDAELARVLAAGVLPEGDLSVFMRFSAANLADEDIVAVLSYLRSLPPERREVPPMALGTAGKVLVRLAFGGLAPRAVRPTAVQAGPEPTVARGEYLAEHVALCVPCHSEIDLSTFEPIGPRAGGGTVEASHHPGEPDLEYAPPNLTSHPTGVTGRLDEDAFVARIRAGRAHVGSIMPWEAFQATSESDLRAIYRYLRTLPPVDRDTGPTARPVGWSAP